MKKEKQKQKYAVMFGFKKSDPDCTAFLKVCDNHNNSHGLYKLVKEAKDATHFSAENYDNKKGFGTPAKWVKFFNTEDDLSDWEFHTITIDKK